MKRKLATRSLECGQPSARQSGAGGLWTVCVSMMLLCSIMFLAGLSVLHLIA